MKERRPNRFRFKPFYLAAHDSELLPDPVFHRVPDHQLRIKLAASRDAVEKLFAIDHGTAEPAGEDDRIIPGARPVTSMAMLKMMALGALALAHFRAVANRRPAILHPRKATDIQSPQPPKGSP